MGATESIVTDILVAVDALLALSVRVTLMLFTPSASGAAGVQVTEAPTAGDGVQVHPVIVAVSQTEVWTMISGVVSIVVEYGDVISPSTEVIVGADGVVVSIVRESDGESPDIFPARSVSR